MPLKTKLLPFIAAGLLLLGSAGPVAADSFPALLCRAPAAGAKPARCNTVLLDDERAEIACQPPGNAAVRRYGCRLVVSGHDAAAPYAHTPRVWHCVSGGTKAYLFAADFFTDAARCELVCGRCAGGWETAP